MIRSGTARQSAKRSARQSAKRSAKRSGARGGNPPEAVATASGVPDGEGSPARARGQSGEGGRTALPEAGAPAWGACVFAFCKSWCLSRSSSKQHTWFYVSFLCDVGRGDISFFAVPISVTGHFRLSTAVWRFSFHKRRRRHRLSFRCTLLLVIGSLHFSPACLCECQDQPPALLSCRGAGLCRYRASRLALLCVACVRETGAWTRSAGSASNGAAADLRRPPVAVTAAEAGAKATAPAESGGEGGGGGGGGDDNAAPAAEVNAQTAAVAMMTTTTRTRT